MTSGKQAFTYDVRVHGIRTYKGARGSTYTVRWRVGGSHMQKTFPSAKLADGYRSDILAALRAGEPFNLTSGLPDSVEARSTQITWLQHCVDFLKMKWPEAAPKYRKSLAESLTSITVGLLPERIGRPAVKELRRALFTWTFALPDPERHPPAELSEILRWLHANSPLISELADLKVVRSALESVSVKLDGGRASPATIARRRSAFRNCLEYAVECRHLPSNPLDEIKRKRLPPAPAIDRRRVANPDQARNLLAAVAEVDPDLEAFFAVIYYAGLRPAETLNLRSDDCSLPDSGWGRLLLTSSFQRAGAAWTDSGDSGEERQLKHRATGDTRIVPAHPNLVNTLRRHLTTYESGPDGRLFVARRGRAGTPLHPPFDRPVSMNTIYRAWARARRAALTEPQLNSLLAKRPYDLRHACLSTWLNAGVSAVQVAEWAGHSLTVLLSVYAKCIDGQEAVALQQIQQVLKTDVVEL